MKKVKIFAHRGASAYAPENTLEAFRLAMEQGADGIELDVQLTKDGELVVIHDETIDRVSNGKGAVRDYTLEELKSFSVSNHFEQYPDVKIPTLREVLELVKPGHMEINIELKTGIFWYPEIEKKVLDLVKEEEMEDRIIYSSFNHYSVQKIKELAPEAEDGLSDRRRDAERSGIYEKYGNQRSASGAVPCKNGRFSERIQGERNRPACLDGQR